MAITVSGIPKVIKEFFKIDGNDILLVKGDAGTGKTIFSLECLINLAKKKHGFYFSTRVDPEVLFKQYPHIRDHIPLQNIIDATSSHILRDSNIQEAILFSTIPEFLRELYVKISRIKSNKESFIIIDSIDAVCEALNVPVSKLMRSFTDFIRKTKANAIVVTEQSNKTKLDFLADGVINLTYRLVDGRIYREMHVEKLRAIKIRNPVMPFTLVEGRLAVAQRTAIPPLEETICRLKEFSDKVIKMQNTTDLSATSFLISERILGKLNSSDFILYETETTIPKTMAMLTTLRAAVGFVTVDFNVVHIPPVYVYSEDLPRIYREILGDKADRIEVLLPHESSSKNFKEKLLDTLAKVRRREKRCAIICSFNALESSFGVEKAKHIADVIITEGKKNKSVTIAIAYEDLKSLSSLRKQADKLLKAFYRDGCYFIYGIQPKTPIYNLHFPKDAKLLTELLEVA